MKKKKRTTRADSGLEAFGRFKTLLRGLVNVRKKEVEAEEARWRADRAAKKKPAT